MIEFILKLYCKIFHNRHHEKVGNFFDKNWNVRSEHVCNKCGFFHQD